MSESLKGKTVRGVAWSALERFSVQGVSFVVMIIMAGMLSPNEYGLVGMLTVFLAISQSLVDSGFSQALMRKMDRTEADNSTAFYFNVAVGVIMYAVLCVSAPLIARFYDEPILTDITRVIGLSIVINSLVVVQRALFTGELDFRTQAKASLLAAVVSGIVGIGMASSGFGVWSIVWYQLSNLGVNASMLWMLSKWRPKLCYSWKSFRELFGFGSKLMVSGLINTIYTNIYLIVIGKIFRASDLGYYTRAHQFAEFPSSNLNGIIQRVTYPVLCSIQNDDERLADVYRRFLKLSAFVIFPLMTGLAATSEPLILLLLNKQWGFTVTLLQIVCFSMMWYPIHSINLNLLQVKGRSDLFLKLEIYKKILGVSIMCVTIPLGLVAMCIGMVFNSIVALTINTYYTGKLIDVGFFKQMRDLTPTLLLSISMSAVVYVCVEAIPFDNMAKLLMGVVIGIVYYLAIAKMFRFKELAELTSLIKRKS